MTLPKTLRIAGLDHAVLIVPKEEIEDEAFGWYRPVPQEIRIRADLTPAHQLSIALHEALHAIDYTARLNLSERQITAGSRLLYAFLVDNPELLEAISEQARGTIGTKQE